MSQIPIEWLIFLEGFEEPPEKQQVSMMIDGISFYQKDILVMYSSTSASLKIYQADP